MNGIDQNGTYPLINGTEGVSFISVCSLYNELCCLGDVIPQRLYLVVGVLLDSSVFHCSNFW